MTNRLSSHREKRKEEKAKKDFSIIDPLSSSLSGSTADNESEIKSSSSEDKGRTIKIKPYIKMTFDEYIKKIQNVYTDYSINHSKKNISVVGINNEGGVGFTYPIPKSQNILKKINPNYLVKDNFSIESEIFTKNMENIQSEISQLIEKSGEIEIETEKIIQNNIELYYHLKRRLPTFGNAINSLYDTIYQQRKKHISIKNKFLTVNAMMMLKKQKKKNLQKMKNSLLLIEKVKKIVNEKNVDMINEASEICEQLKNFVIVSQIKKQLSYLINSRNENIINDMEKAIDYLLGIITECFSKENDNNIKEEPRYKEIESLKEKVLSIEKTLPQDSIEKTEKKYISKANDTLLIIISTFISLKTKNENLFVKKAISSSQEIFDVLTSIFPSDFFKEELNKKIVYALNENISFIFSNKNSPLLLTPFMEKKYYLQQLFTSFNITSRNEFIYLPQLEKSEIDFISRIFIEHKTKLFNLIKEETFLICPSLPSPLQDNINKISTFVLSELDSFEKTKKFFEKSENLQESSYLFFPKNEKKFTIIKSATQIVNSAYEMIQMLSTFSIQSYNDIISIFYTEINDYLNETRKIILENNNSISKNVDVTQNEIAALYNTVTFISEVITRLFHNNKILVQFTQGKFSSFFDEAVKNAQNTLKMCETKIVEMIREGCVNASVELFREIDFDNYPNSKSTNQVNQFAIVLMQRIKAMFTAVNEIFEKEFVVKAFESNLDIFAEEIKKILDNVIEIPGEEEKKQFKRDFLVIKKNINAGPMESIIELKAFKKKISGIYTKFIPKDKKAKVGSNK